MLPKINPVHNLSSGTIENKNQNASPVGSVVAGLGLGTVFYKALGLHFLDGLGGVLSIAGHIGRKRSEKKEKVERVEKETASEARWYQQKTLQEQTVSTLKSINKILEDTLDFCIDSDREMKLDSKELIKYIQNLDNSLSHIPVWKQEENKKKSEKEKKTGLEPKDVSPKQGKIFEEIKEDNEKEPSLIDKIFGKHFSYFKKKDDKERIKGNQVELDDGEDDSSLPKVSDFLGKIGTMLKEGVTKFFSKFFSMLFSKLMEQIVAGGAVATMFGKILLNSFSKESLDRLMKLTGAKSDIGAVMGGLFAQVGNDWSAYFSNMGKWAGIGATMGLPMGLGGVLAGGLIGAGLGFVFQAIGMTNFTKIGDGIATLAEAPLGEAMMMFWDGLKDGVTELLIKLKDIVLGFLNPDEETIKSKLEEKNPKEIEKEISEKEKHIAERKEEQTKRKESLKDKNWFSKKWTESTISGEEEYLAEQEKELKLLKESQLKMKKVSPKTPETKKESKTPETKKESKTPEVKTTSQKIPTKVIEPVFPELESKEKVSPKTPEEKAYQKIADDEIKKVGERVRLGAIEMEKERMKMVSTNSQPTNVVAPTNNVVNNNSSQGIVMQKPFVNQETGFQKAKNL